MKYAFNFIYFLALLQFPLACAKEPLIYKITDLKSTDNVLIQTVTFKLSTPADSSVSNKINSKLKLDSNDFGRKARECRLSADNQPWEYRINVDKILQSEKYISVVFSKFAVCAGSPDIEKEARVFSRMTGDFIPSKKLLKDIFPTIKVATGDTDRKELLRFEEKTIKTMIKNKGTTLTKYNSDCDSYLKNAYYHVWIDGITIVLFPEFFQQQSYCQGEYLIQKVD